MHRNSITDILQFQVTVNITAVVLTFVSSVANDDEKSVLTAVQLLWVNLIMDTFAALALATDPPAPSILDRPPEPKSAPLITVTMWKMIIGQSIYQLVVTLLLYFCGLKWLSYTSDSEREQFPTLIFNIFVWMQIFNQYNNRRLDNKFNILEGVTRNYFFIGIQFIIIGAQIMIVFVGGRAFSTVRLNRARWIYSILLGFFSIPIGMLIRLIPDEFVRKLIPKWFVRKTKPKVMVTDEERQIEFNPEIEAIRDELAFLKKIRGGRLSSLKYKLQHPSLFIPRSRSNSTVSRTHSQRNSPPGTPNHELADHEHGPPTPDSRRSLGLRSRSHSNSAFGPAAAMAGVIAGSVAGWSPVGRKGDDAVSPHHTGGDPLGDDHTTQSDHRPPSRNSTANSREPLTDGLASGGLQPESGRSQSQTHLAAPEASPSHAGSGHPAVPKLLAPPTKS